MSRLSFGLTAFLILRTAHADTTLFNGAQDTVFEDASSECLAAFDTRMACNDKVQLLGGFDMDTLAFTEADLSDLCNTNCKGSLEVLRDAVSSACGDYDIDFNGAFISATEVVDLFAYKFDMTCLADSSRNFCAMVEESWDVDALVASGQATWPTFTQKEYPDFTEGKTDGAPARDIDGTLIDNSDDPIIWPAWEYHVDLEDSGEDYFQEPISPDWRGHGYDDPLEYDEYPLEIQCSECFLASYKRGIESQWGEVYDEVSDQVWNNLKRNCDLDWELAPANNLSTWLAEYSEVVWEYNTTCEQTIDYQSDQPITVDDLAFQNNVPSAALLHLNEDIGVNTASSGSYCAPFPCQVVVIGGQDPTSANNFVDKYDNISLTQFWLWNNYMEPNNMRPAEVVCIGPPGGFYTPVSVPQAVPSVYTTTATPPAPTVSGTTRSCGRYYQIKAGESCADVSVANSITVSELLSINQQLDEKCTNLLAGYAYCVASVNGTSTDPSPTQSSMSTTTPTPIQDGMTKRCNTFYEVKSGDGCWDIANTHGISLNDFYSFNPAVGDDCSKLYPDNYVCVGVAESCHIDVVFKTMHKTEWGEGVWVIGSWNDWDVNKPLILEGSSGEDGLTNWEGTADLLTETQFSYKFVKVQADGTLVWEDDPNRGFETPGCSSLTIQQGGKWHDGTPSCTAVDIVFEVEARTAFGEAIYVIGSVADLGSWNTGAAIPLAANDYTEDHPLWRGTISLVIGQEVQYKFIKINMDGNFSWEADPNRQLTVPTDCAATPSYSSTWQ